MLRSSFVLSLCGAFAVLFAGCGPGSVGDRVSGTATFDGAPIPVGMIYFDPDASRGGSGTQGAAKIVDGKFDTSESGQGAPTGAVTLRIEGYEKHASDPDSFGNMICKWATEETLAGGAVEKTFDVPTSASVKAPTGPVEQP